MVYLACCLTNLLFFNISLLYCYINLNLSIICCLSFGDLHLFSGTSISLIASSFFKRSSAEDFETLVILTAVLLPIKSPVASAIFLNCSF